MKLETKYNIGDEIYYINENKKIKKDCINRINIFISEKASISYSLSDSFSSGSIYQEHAFSTKEELIDSLDED